MLAHVNDGQVVVSLCLMVAAIEYAMVSAVVYYAHASSTTKSKDPSRLPRLLSGWANIGNSVVHVLLLVYMTANHGNQSEFWAKERELGGVEGPAVIMLLNLAAGVCALRGWSMSFPLGWNSFVAVTGTLIPIVWPRFISEGLQTWPCIIVFIWLAIFAMELTAVTSSVVHFALKKGTKTD
jgi:hypothetical protein